MTEQRSEQPRPQTQMPCPWTAQSFTLMHDAHKNGKAEITCSNLIGWLYTTSEIKALRKYLSNKAGFSRTWNYKINNCYVVYSFKTYKDFLFRDCCANILLTKINKSYLGVQAPQVQNTSLFVLRFSYYAYYYSFSALNVCTSENLGCRDNKFCGIVINSTTKAHVHISNWH